MKTNGNPRFVKHEQLRSFYLLFIIVMKSGVPLLGLAKSIYYMYFSILSF